MSTLMLSAIGPDGTSTVGSYSSETLPAALQQGYGINVSILFPKGSNTAWDTAQISSQVTAILKQVTPNRTREEVQDLDIAESEISENDLETAHANGYTQYSLHNQTRIKFQKKTMMLVTPDDTTQQLLASLNDLLNFVHLAQQENSTLLNNQSVLDA